MRKSPRLRRGLFLVYVARYFILKVSAVRSGRPPHQLFKDRVKVIHIANTNLLGNLAGAQVGGQQKMLCLPDAAAV